MATATITYSTIVSDASAGGTAITNPGNAASVNGTYATVVLLDALSRRLKFTDGSGGSAIDDAATIQSIRHYCRAKRANDTASIIECYLVKGGTTQTGATNHAATPVALGTSDTTHQLGASDTFGVSLTGADVKDSGFGGSLRFADAAANEEGATISIDAVWSEVDYTNPVPALHAAPHVPRLLATGVLP